MKMRMKRKRRRKKTKIHPITHRKALSENRKKTQEAEQNQKTNKKR